MIFIQKKGFTYVSALWSGAYNSENVIQIKKLITEYHELTHNIDIASSYGLDNLSLKQGNRILGTKITKEIKDTIVLKYVSQYTRYKYKLELEDLCI